MYAVIKTGGKQYKVTENDLLRIEKVEAEAGSIITLDDVLLVANDNNNVTVGSPLIEGASVAVEILAQRRARKVIVFKKRRRKSSRTKNGHRQHFTLVRISEILTQGAKPSKPAQGMPEKVSLKAINDDDLPLHETTEVTETKPVKKSSKKSVIESDIIDAVVETSEDIQAITQESEKKPTKKSTKKAKTEATDSSETSND